MRISPCWNRFFCDTKGSLGPTVDFYFASLEKRKFDKVVYGEENELLSKLEQIGLEFHSPLTEIVKKDEEP